MNIVQAWKTAKTEYVRQCDRVGLIIDEACREIQAECGQNPDRYTTVRVGLNQYLRSRGFKWKNIPDDRSLFDLMGYTNPVLGHWVSCHDHRTPSITDHFHHSLKQCREVTELLAAITPEMARNLAEQQLLQREV